MTAQQILAELVTFPVLGGQSNMPVLHWIEEYLKRHGVDYTLVPNEDGSKACLHCRIGPASDGGVILSGHMDVVPTTGQPWDTDPFELVEWGDKLYARGSCDMKGFLACCLASVPHLQSAKLKRPVYFAFSYDEEIGCMAGDIMAEAIRDHYSERPLGAIIGEPTMMRPIVGQKGIIVYTTTVRGSQGHSSRIKEEVDAVHEAAHLIVWLEEKMDGLIAAGHTDDRFSPNHTSIHVGKVAGGTAFNIIANECTFDWDYRTIPSDDAAQIFADFENYCRERETLRRSTYPDFSISSEAMHRFVPPLDTAEDAAIVDLIKRVSGHTDTGTVSFAAEAGQFSDAGFASVICGPGDIAQAHRANEFVTIEQLNDCTDTIGRIASELSV